MQRGFTLLEILVVLGIAAVMLGVSGPYAQKMYQTMQYHGAVKDVMTALIAGRYEAISRSESVDVRFDPQARTVNVGSKKIQLPENIQLSAATAREYNRLYDGNLAVVRFFADGSSSGGSISLVRESGAGVQLTVDWLLGSVSQAKLAENTAL